jgi:hypothetical protein
VRERIHAKPDSPYNWRQQARLSGATAGEAERRAAALRGAARP